MFMDFTYDTKPKTHAKYAMNIKVDQLEFKEAYKNIVSVEAGDPKSHIWVWIWGWDHATNALGRGYEV